MLDTARFTNFVAEKAGVPVGSVRTLTLGSHGDTMVPVPSACTVDGKPLTDVLAAEDIEELVTRTRNGGAEVVALLKTGSAYYAPSAAAARMARAVAEDSGERHAGLRLGGRPVRDLRRVPGRRGGDRRRRGQARGGARPDRVRAVRPAARRPRRSAPSRPTSPASDAVRCSAVPGQAVSRPAPRRRPVRLPRGGAWPARRRARPRRRARRRRTPPRPSGWTARSPGPGPAGTRPPR